MRISGLALILAAAVVLGAGAPARAQAPGILYADSLRTEWTVEPTRNGRAHVVGYLYNSNIKDAARVVMRVDRVAADGTVAGTYRAWVVGDVLSHDRGLFDVPVPEATATYRVSVEAVDWVKECR
ncbi:MAG TPA: hypothetical protein VEH80_05335 [Candidatus Bathyarchaeia archaeon]|nr:hypothetical protein [Candidatus Bathyarchaeia archaeon]